MSDNSGTYSLFIFEKTLNAKEIQITKQQGWYKNHSPILLYLTQYMIVWIEFINISPNFEFKLLYKQFVCFYQYLFEKVTCFIKKGLYYFSKFIFCPKINTFDDLKYWCFDLLIVTMS